MRLRTVSILFIIGLFTVSSVDFQWESPTSVLAQSSSHEAPPIEWSYGYGGEKYSVEQTSDKGFIVVAQHGLIKLDPHGNEQWSNNLYEKSGYESNCLAGHQTIDGGYFMAGHVHPSLEDVYDVCLVKTDEIGNHQWNKTYEGGGNEIIHSAQQTSDGGYILAGSAEPFGVNAFDFYLMKTDGMGNAEWNKTYRAQNDSTALSVQQTTNGGYVLAGESYSVENRWDAWVVGTDAAGNMVWNITINQTPQNDWVNSIRLTSDGGYIMAGCYYLGDSGGGTFWLIKLDSEGSVQWNRTYGYGGFPSRGGQANSVCQTSDGGYIAVGGERFDEWGEVEVWLVKTDSYGSMTWNGTYGKGYGLSVIQTEDGGYAFSTGAMVIKTMRANPPVASFVYSPVNASVQQKMVFNASASYDLDEDIVSYVWDFDDGNVTTVSSPIISHRYESPRTYNVTLTITDGEELNSSLSKEVWVRVATYIEMSVIDWAYIGVEIGVSGRLYDIFGHYLRNENVTLQWYIGGNMWTALGWDMTNEYGDYAIVWNPPTVTSYMLKVRWSGNQTFHAAENTKTTSIRSIPTRISLALSSSTSLIGFKIGISGDLISEIRAVSNTPILLSYSVTGGQTWNDITQMYTASDGHYSAVWMPTATGNYIVKAVWIGNSTYPKASKTVNLAVIPFEERNVFSVISNSTVSELSFESVHKELTFTVEGVAGTTGYVDVYIAKRLIADIEGVEVKLNGTEIEYEAISVDYSWLIHFTYQHSVHTIVVDLAAETESVDVGLPLLPYVIAGAAAVIVISGIVLMRRRKQKVH